ncbi:hypothetical protein UCDDS831_g05170 [Diplodia seriata]|uniref:Uncharacterized protein n=1 Tax=Diplodia seriata TaxID=420778 RepID=A0A0G2GSY7_9PEZI|nr:hypothetical protein UCDDS831_g05170 [Diplodia seriata]
MHCNRWQQFLSNNADWHRLKWHCPEYHYFDWNYLDCHCLKRHWLECHYFDWNYLDCHWLERHWLEYHYSDWNYFDCHHCHRSASHYPHRYRSRMSQILYNWVCLLRGCSVFDDHHFDIELLLDLDVVREFAFVLALLLANFFNQRSAGHYPHRYRSRMS